MYLLTLLIILSEKPKCDPPAPHPTVHLISTFSYIIFTMQLYPYFFLFLALLFTLLLV